VIESAVLEGDHEGGRDLHPRGVRIETLRPTTGGAVGVINL
jgi:hypothetical protein